MATRPVVDTRGIGELLRDLRKIDKRLGASLFQELKAVGNKATTKIHSSTAKPHRTGGLRRSVKTRVRGGTIAIGSNLPQANVNHWGGTIKPRGVPINFERTEFVRKPVLELGEHLDDEMAGILDATAARYQFH